MLINYILIEDISQYTLTNLQMHTLILSVVLHFSDKLKDMQWVSLDSYSHLSLRQETTVSSLLSERVDISAPCSQILGNRYIVADK